MARFLVPVVLALALAAPAAAAIRVVEPFPLDRYAGSGAVGLAVPGAGPTVTRASARNTLLTGKVVSSLLGGASNGAPLIELGSGPPPDTLVVLPPPGRSENTRYPIAVTPGPRGVLTSRSTRIDGLVSLADVAHGRLEVVAVRDPVGTLKRLEHRIERNDRIRLPLTLLLGGLAYVVAVLAPGLAPRVVLVGLAANLWLAGWWVVALVALAAALLPLGLACAAVLAAYLVVLGLDAEAIALSPFGPSQAGRFYGVSNLLETMLLVPAILGPALLRRSLGIGLAAITLVAVAGSRFGADGGGLLVLLAAYATLIVRTSGIRLDARRLAALVVAATAAAIVLVGLDAAFGGSSHVTQAVGDGPGAVLGDIANRLDLSARRTFAAIGPVFAVAASLAVLLVVATRRPRRPLTDAVLVALLVSLLVNDTPGDVVGFGAVAAFVIRRFEDGSERGARTHLVRLRAMRRPLAALALLLAVVAIVAAGCGGEEVTATPETVVGAIPTQTTSVPTKDLPALKLKGDATAGKEVFESAGCVACHTLKEANATGTVGPNLDEAKPSFELVVDRVTLGLGGMPSFKDQLQPQQIADVAQFVSTATGG